jgi:predicted DNA-binding transcriptional regulator YafY
MSRTTRLFDLLQLLRRHRRPVSGATLAGEIGVSLRTLYRDIASLQALGAEVEGEPGVGYVLKPGFLLPPLMFSAEEIEALALGLRWISRQTDAELDQAARQALAKISAVLPTELREKLEDDALLVVPRRAPPQAVSLAVLRQALSRERKLAIVYADENSAITQRIIWPIALGFFETTRMLAAWCELRDGFRHFRADRLLAADILPAPLPRRRRALMQEWRETMLTKTDSGEG